MDSLHPDAPRQEDGRPCPAGEPGFRGPPGVGKSHLAVALGVKASKNGFSTTHFLLDDLMHVLKGDAAPRGEKRVG